MTALRSLLAVWVAALLLVIGSGPAAALDPATTGVVLVHGKWSDPGTVRPVTDALRQAGFLVETPVMPWASNRLYDRAYDEAAAEIDAAAARLTSQGAKRIVIAGHSLGGAAAFYYASLGKGVVAAVVIAPAPYPEGRYIAEKAGDSVERARKMVQDGEGDQVGSFLDINSDNRSRVLEMTARRYLSYYDPQGPAAMSLSAPRLGGVPLLWVAPNNDPGTQGFATLVVPKLPADARLERADVTAFHMGAPMAGRQLIVDWLKVLP